MIELNHAHTSPNCYIVFTTSPKCLNTPPATALSFFGSLDFSYFIDYLLVQ